jgi:hypothetical protein
MISCSATAISSSSNFCSGLSATLAALGSLVLLFDLATGVTTFGGAALGAAALGVAGGCLTTRAMSGLSFPYL